MRIPFLPVPDGFFNRFIWLFRRGVFLSRTMLQMELVAEDLYDGLFSMLIPEVLIEDLPVRFAAVAMDLLTGEEIVLTKGSLRRAVAASSSIPGMFPAIQINGRTLVDGGWTDNVPVAPAIALGAHFVLASDATLEVSGMATEPKSAMEILFRCNEISRVLLTRHLKSAADVLITPEIGNISWADFNSLDHCLAAGRKAFDQNSSAILKQLLVRRFQTLEGTIHPGRFGEWRHRVPDNVTLRLAFPCLSGRPGRNLRSNPPHVLRPGRAGNLQGCMPNPVEVL